MEEIFDELDQNAGRGDTDIAIWFEGFGKVIQWAGNGDETVLPEFIHAWLVQNHPEEVKLAIEAPANV